MKKKHYLLAGLLVLAAIAWFLVEQGGTMKAAPTYMIKIGSEQTAGTGEYELKRKTISATFTDENNNVPAVSSISWTLSDPNILSIESGATTPQVNLKAIGAGTVELIAKITAGATTSTVARTIVVGYTIDENPQNGFTLNEKISNKSIMALEIGEGGTLDFIFPATSPVTWSSGDSRVVSMAADGNVSENTTGVFRAVGVGKTTITALYKTAEGSLASVSVDVYVGPEVTDSSSQPISNTITVSNKDLIYVGAILQNTNKVIKDRIEWVIKDSNDQVIGDSLTTPVNLISASPYHPYLTVDARAGEYHIDIYTAGVYSKGADIDKLRQSFVMKVKAECGNHIGTNSIYLQINDTYDIASAFNMTPEDFADCFTVTYLTTPPLVSLDAAGAGVITANKEGKQEIEIQLKAGKLPKLQTLMDDPTIAAGQVYKLEVNIYESFKLDRSSVDLAVGGSLQLRPLYGTLGEITWSSADESYVKVDQNGIVTGVKETTGGITVTASMLLADGRTLKASCTVAVHKTAEEIILSTNSLRLQNGQSSTITATFIPSSITSIPGLKWILTDEDIVSLDVNSNKSVIVTAKKAGTTILTAVNEDNFVSAYCTITVLTPISSISLEEGEEMVVKLSQEAIKFHAKYDSDATDLNLKWSSSNAAVATVDETGFMELLSAGTTVITVVPEWNPNNIMAQCRVTVLQSATAFALDKSAVTMEVGEKITLSPAVTPNNATTTITWKSLGTSIATVTDKGVVTAVAAGQTYIVASTENGYVANCLITVNQKATGVKLSDYNITINVGESYEVTATPNPSTSTEKKFTWTSKDPSIATVSSGKVTGVSAGSTIILVKTSSGDVAYLYVTVKDKAKGMELNYSTKTVAKGSTFTLKAIFTPSNASNKNVTWTSSNTAIATVSEKGKVKGVKGGSAIITAVAEDGGYVATCLVTVVQPVSTIELNHSSYKLGVGKSFTLKAEVTSDTSSNPKVKWTSSNTKIATVSSSGRVTGKKIGSCTITARVTDGSNKKATCKITVVRQATSIKLNKSYLTVVAGENVRLKATVKPSNATYKTVNWSSSDTAVARVDNGLVRGIAPGSCSIKVAAKDNSKKSDTCYVEVIDPIPATSVIVSGANLVMIRGESQMISYNIVPSNSTDSVEFASSNKNIATVSSTGRVYARRAGASSITITTSSGRQTVIQLQVIGLNKTSITLEQYDTETLTVDGVTSGISWYSANPAIATVSNGKVVGRKAGTTTIYAKVSGITLGCRVTVRNIS